MADELITSPVEKTTPADVETQLNEMPGRFVQSLTRNNKKIRADRALAIAEGAQLIFKRTVEDLITDIKKLKREREALLDMSPTDAQSLVLASDFDEKQFVQKYLGIGTKIREKEILLEIATASYTDLFGKL